MSEVATCAIAARKCAVVATAADSASLVFGGEDYPMMSLEISAEGIISDVILPASVLPVGLDLEDEVIITFARRRCRVCEESKAPSWADVDLCTPCNINLALGAAHEGAIQCSE